jgi:putative transposase
MSLADLLSESYAAEFDACWERERRRRSQELRSCAAIKTRSVPRTPVRVFAVRLHATGCALGEIQAILRLIGVKRSHQAIWHWKYSLCDSIPDPPRAKPPRVAVDEAAVKIIDDWFWAHAAINLDSRLSLDVAVFGRRGTDPAAVFLHWLTEIHDLSKAMFLVDGYGYLTAISRL